MAREITLRKDANKALEASHNTAEVRDSSPKIKDRRQRKKKGGGDGTEADTSQAQVSLPSGVGDAKCKHCGHPGHMVSLCPRKAAEKRGESEQLLAESQRNGNVCQLCAAVGIKDGIHRARHHGFAAADQYASGGGGGDKNGKGKGKGKAKEPVSREPFGTGLHSLVRGIVKGHRDLKQGVNSLLGSGSCFGLCSFACQRGTSKRFILKMENDLSCHLGISCALSLCSMLHFAQCMCSHFLEESSRPFMSAS